VRFSAQVIRRHDRHRRRLRRARVAPTLGTLFALKPRIGERCDEGSSRSRWGGSRAVGPTRGWLLAAGAIGSPSAPSPSPDQRHQRHVRIHGAGVPRRAWWPSSSRQRRRSGSILHRRSRASECGRDASTSGRAEAKPFPSSAPAPLSPRANRRAAHRAHSQRRRWPRWILSRNIPGCSSMPACAATLPRPLRRSRPIRWLSRTGRDMAANRGCVRRTPLLPGHRPPRLPGSRRSPARTRQGPSWNPRGGSRRRSGPTK
jgi:hypothetical protein